MVSGQAFPSLLPRAPLTFVSRLKLEKFLLRFYMQFTLIMEIDSDL